MYINKLNRDDIADFLGKYVYNPDNKCGTSNDDIYHNNSRLFMQNLEYKIQAQVGYKSFSFSDFDICSTICQSDEQRENLSKAWEEFMTEKFGEPYKEDLIDYKKTTLDNLYVRLENNFDLKLVQQIRKYEKELFPEDETKVATYLHDFDKSVEHEISRSEQLKNVNKNNDKEIGK